MEQLNVGDGTMIVELACSKQHVYHVHCIKKWVETKDSCPMCREPILID
jgi:hypothetical protein